MRPVPIGTLIRFHTPDFFLVVESFLLDATSSTVVILGEKRAHSEMSAIGGDHLETGEKNLSWIVDLDGVAHPTRSKKDLNQREVELYFAFRVLDKERRTHLMGLNLVLQPSEYLRMVEEQAKTRASGREM